MSVSNTCCIWFFILILVVPAEPFATLANLAPGRPPDSVAGSPGESVPLAWRGSTRSTVSHGVASLAPDSLNYRIVSRFDSTYAADLYSLVDGEVRPVERTYDAEYLTIEVPERAGDRRIELPIIRIRATGTTQGDPVIWFEGGPGQSNLKTFDFDYFIDHHDHIMIGYRGVDGSVSLDCPEVSAAIRESRDVLADATLDAVGDAYEACWARLTASGIDMNGYTILDVVDDVERARRALGYDRVHLVGESFGTRLAMLYGHRYPERVHRLILVGANPPGGMIWDPYEMDRLLGEYARLWAADPAASARTTDLQAAIRSVNAQMPERWLFLPIHPGNVQASSFVMLAQRESASKVFDAYVAAFNGDPSGLWMISFVSRFIYPEIVNWGDNASKAVSADYVPNVDYRSAFTPDDAVMGAPLGRFLWEPAEHWKTDLIPESYRHARPSDIETLVISGSLDFSTPAVNAERELMPTLSRGHHVILEEAGHLEDLWLSQPRATRRMTRTFLRTGSPDTSAVRYVPMNFTVSLGYPLLAKLLLAAVIVALLLVGAAATWGVRRLRRE